MLLHSEMALLFSAMQTSPEKQRSRCAASRLPLYSDDDVDVRRIEFAAHLSPPTGARCQSERLAWPQATWKELTSTMRDRLVRNLRRIQHKDYFAGSGSASQIFHQMVKFLNGLAPLDIPPVHETNACEWCPVRRDLIQRRLHSLPDHVQGDIMDRLPDAIRKEIKGMEAEKSSTLLAKKQCNRKIAMYIDELYNEGGYRFSRCKCDRHPHAQCPVGVNINDEDLDGEVLIDSDEDHMRAVTAGCPCVDNSAMNLFACGDGGRTFTASSLFLSERAYMREDWIYIECTPGWNCGLVRARLPSCFQVCRLTLRGEDVGDAYDRERMGCMAYNEEKHIVTVPLESYLDFVAARPAINVDEFWSSTLEEQDDEIREFLERRVHPVGIGDFGLNWDDIMLPSQKKRRLDYDMEYERKVREGHCFPGEVAIYDLDQQLGSHGRVLVDSIAGRPAKLPTLITHGCWWNRNKQTVLTAVDQLRVHGWPVTEAEMQEHGTIIDWKAELKNDLLKHKHVVQMMGDSWHIPVQGRFLMFWLSVLQERTYTPPTVGLPPVSSEEGEEGDEIASQGSVVTISVSSSNGDDIA